MKECVWKVQEHLRELQGTLQMSLGQGKGSPRMHSQATGAQHQKSVPHSGSQSSISLPFLYADTKQVLKTLKLRGTLVKLYLHTHQSQP